MTNFTRARSSEQKEERMEEIKRAAERQFSQRTYQSITLSTIAEELSWSRANLYKYVTSKEEIFLELSADKYSRYLGGAEGGIPAGLRIFRPGGSQGVGRDSERQHGLPEVFRSFVLDYRNKCYR